LFENDFLFHEGQLSLGWISFTQNKYHQLLNKSINKTLIKDLVKMIFLRIITGIKNWILALRTGRNPRKRGCELHLLMLSYPLSKRLKIPEWN